MTEGYWLWGRAWAANRAAVAEEPAGSAAGDDRRVISGIIHVLKSGCRWKDCPRVATRPHDMTR